MADKFQLYLEIESRNSDDWNSIRSLVETLNGIDIKPRDEMNQQILEDLEEGNEIGEDFVGLVASLALFYFSFTIKCD